MSLSQSQPNSIKVTMLGCGTSTGVPTLLCPCEVCHSDDPKDKRLRASIWVETPQASVLVDTSSDFRQQALRAKINRLDAILLTHPHIDHIGGLDELRAYTFRAQKSLPVYCHEWTNGEITKKFDYIFNGERPEGGKVAQLSIEPVTHSVEKFNISEDLQVQPIFYQHGSKECVGYRFESIAYIPDCSYIPPSSLERLRGLEVLILDCVKIEPHPTHFNLEKALSTIQELQPKRAILTHLSHDFRYRDWATKLPKGVELAFDQMVIKASRASSLGRTLDEMMKGQAE